MIVVARVPHSRSINHDHRRAMAVLRDRVVQADESKIAECNRRLHEFIRTYAAAFNAPMADSAIEEVHQVMHAT